MSKISWPFKTLGEICELVRRGRPPSYCEDGGLVVLNQKCVRNGKIDFGPSRRTDNNVKAIPEWAYLREGDTLINSTGAGTLGRASFVSILNEPTTFDTHLTVVRPRKDLCWPAFIGLVLHAREKDIVDLAGGATGQTELPREAVRSLEIPVPPLEEQKRIVELLDAATARITELSAYYEQARTHASNLFRSVLCEVFEDADAKSTTRLGEICIDIVDCEHKTVPVDESGIAWAVGTRAMSRGEIDFSKAKPISSATYAEWTRRMVPKLGDLILAREAPVGPVVRVPGAPKVALGQRTVLIRPDTNVVFTPFLHYLLLSEPIQRSMHFKSEGSVVSHLNVKDVRLLSLPMLPSLEEQKRIVAHLDAMRAKTSEMVAASDAKLTSAKNLRQSILEAAFAGDL
jgi:type I restriction enzyme S subunit